MITNQMIEELENIRVKLTQIYFQIDKEKIEALGNNEADMILRREIELIKQNKGCSK